jgi:hypothetical protein
MVDENAIENYEKNKQEFELGAKKFPFTPIWGF